MSTVFKNGEQIAYVPLHANGDLNHPDVEFGFVTGPAGEDAYFCRYWRKGELGVLRTRANSESTSADMLVSVWSVPQATVDAAIDEIREAIATHLDMLADEEDLRTVPRWYVG